VVRFARLIQWPVRVLGGPSARAACGGSRKPAQLATQGGTARAGNAPMCVSERISMAGT
jgi:hypothetical protein